MNSATVVEVATARMIRRVDDAYRTYTAAEANVRERRLELGRALLEARVCFPATGRNAGGWSRFLADRGIHRDVALDAMKYAEYVAAHPGKPLPTREQAGLCGPAKVTTIDEAFAEFSSRIAELKTVDIATMGERVSDDFRAQFARIAKSLRVNVSGGSGETDRSAWCTAQKWAERVGPWDVDPFSNPRSYIVAERRCMLENGGDGLADLAQPGSWREGGEHAVGVASHAVADEDTRTWGQPPYSIVEQAVQHYRHTRFCFLLRLDPSTAWFELLWERTQVLAIALGDREMFEPPPGVVASSNPQPHAFYYADPRDITDAIRETCILLTRYEAQRHPALHIVR